MQFAEKIKLQQLSINSIFNILLQPKSVIGKVSNFVGMVFQIELFWAKKDYILKAESFWKFREQKKIFWAVLDIIFWNFWKILKSSHSPQVNWYLKSSIKSKVQQLLYDLLSNLRFRIIARWDNLGKGSYWKYISLSTQSFLQKWNCCNYGWKSHRRVYLKFFTCFQFTSVQIFGTWLYLWTWFCL